MWTLGSSSLVHLKLFQSKKGRDTILLRLVKIGEHKKKVMGLFFVTVLLGFYDYSGDVSFILLLGNSKILVKDRG